MKTGTVRISFEWVGAPLSPFYVTPKLRSYSLATDEGADGGEGGEEGVVLAAGKQAKRMMLRILTAVVLIFLGTTLGAVLIMPSLRVGAGKWAIEHLKESAWAQSGHELVRDAAVASRNFCANLSSATGALHFGYLSRFWAWVWASVGGGSFGDLLAGWGLAWEGVNGKYLLARFHWIGAEAMLAAAVLLTVKLILWADRNGVVAALMQPPWKWFELDKVREEYNERRGSAPQQHHLMPSQDIKQD